MRYNQNGSIPRNAWLSPWKHKNVWPRKVWLPRKCDYWTDRQADRRRTKWSLCAAILHRRHKNWCFGNRYKTPRIRASYLNCKIKMPWIKASSQATVFESVFYSLHTVAAWACLTSIAWIYYDLIRPIRWLPETTRPDTQRRSSSNEMTPFTSRSV